MSQQKTPVHNPFVNVRLGNSFWEKADLVGEILQGRLVKGTNDNPEKKLHQGIVSYALLILTLGLPILVVHLKTHKNPQLQNLGAVLAALLFPVLAIFSLLLAIIKILALPIIGIIQLYLYFHSQASPSATKAPEYSNYQEIVDYNPFSHLSLDHVSETSFNSKLSDTMAVLWGCSPRNLIGLVRYLLVIPILLDFGLKSQNPGIFYLSKFLQLLFAPIEYAFLFLLTLLNIALLPIVGTVHLLAQPVIPGQTPVWKSFLTSPMTWLGLATIAAIIGFVIQAANPLIFNQAVGALAVMVPSFLAVGGLMAFGYLVYSFLKAVIPEQPSPEGQKSTKYTNPVADAFRERIEWIKAYPFFSIPFLIIGIATVLTAIVLSVLYLTGNLLPDTLIGQIVDTVFQFMNSAFTGDIQGLGNLPGLEFFASISTGTLATLSQIFSALALTLGSFCLFDMAMRFASTLVRTPETEIRYSTVLCKEDAQSHPIPKHFVHLGKKDDAYEIKNGDLYRVVLQKTNQGKQGNETFQITESKLATTEDFRPERI